MTNYSPISTYETKVYLPISTHIIYEYLLIRHKKYLAICTYKMYKYLTSYPFKRMNSYLILNNRSSNAGLLSLTKIIQYHMINLISMTIRLIHMCTIEDDCRTCTFFRRYFSFSKSKFGV